MTTWFSILISTADVANKINDDGEALADLFNTIGNCTGGDPGWAALAEFADNLDDDGRNVLSALATAAGLIPEADHVDD